MNYVGSELGFVFGVGYSSHEFCMLISGDKVGSEVGLKEYILEWK